MLVSTVEAIFQVGFGASSGTRMQQVPRLSLLVKTVMLGQLFGWGNGGNATLGSPEQICKYASVLSKLGNL